MISLSSHLGCDNITSNQPPWPEIGSNAWPRFERLHGMTMQPHRVGDIDDAGETRSRTSSRGGQPVFPGSGSSSSRRVGWGLARAAGARLRTRAARPGGFKGELDLPFFYTRYSTERGASTQAAPPRLELCPALVVVVVVPYYFATALFAL